MSVINSVCKVTFIFRYVQERTLSFLQHNFLAVGTTQRAVELRELWKERFVIGASMSKQAVTDTYGVTLDL